MTGQSRALVIDGGEMFVRNALGIVVIQGDGTQYERIRLWDTPDQPQNARVLAKDPAGADFGVRPSAEQQRAETLIVTPEDARAIYHALGEHFGGTPHDTRLLRKDLDAERARVDLLIRSVTKIAER